MSGERETLSIGELADLAGVTPRTIRYYVTEGLLPPPGGAGQQRTYSEEHLLRLKVIKHLKDLYLPLDEIKRQLSEASLADLERLSTSTEVQPRRRALDYITSVLGRQAANPVAQAPASSVAPPAPARSASQPAPAPLPPAAMPSPVVAESAAAGLAPATAKKAAEPEQPTATLWQRLELAEGVELHYQEQQNPDRASRLQRLITLARHLFPSHPPQGNDQSENKGDSHAPSP